ncbi:MAG: hypothetical protein KBD37_07900, partial [Burkholderiales bacterium]|nr:hypothetical protein [Burkholderiales bacterium]
LKQVLAEGKSIEPYLLVIQHIAKHYPREKFNISHFANMAEAERINPHFFTYIGPALDQVKLRRPKA